MLAAPKNFVKGTPETPSGGPSLGFFGILLRAALAIAGGGIMALNLLVAYRDAAEHRNRAAAIEKELDTTRSRNERIQDRIQGLSGNPALLERWLREGGQTLPGEEVLK